MRRYYPYLLDESFETEGQQIEKRNFLKQIDDFVNQKQYVRVTLLSWDEEPLKEIQGEISSGTLSKDGSSAVRCTCQMSFSIDAGSYDVDDADMDFAINKKIFLEVGIRNDTGEYSEYPILWFPQGVFFISSFACSSSTSSVVTINLTLKDKMCGLNGEVGGTFPATVILDEMDTQSASGAYISEKVLIYDIIQELVNHYGGESLENIVIEDVPERVKQVVKWNGENPIYLISQTQNGYTWYEFSEDEPSSGQSYLKKEQGEDIGYIRTDFVYSNELTCNLGDTVVTALDKIKSYLGNYEYFYDEFGVFHFREIKNYLNTTQATVLINDMSENDYLVDYVDGKSSYAFSDKTNLISITNTPQYENIKNDYVIQGTQSGTSSSAEVTIRYHLAIDKKPQVGNSYYDLLIYREADTNLKKIAFPLHVYTLPEVGNFNIIYRWKHDETDENGATTSFVDYVYWEDDVYKDVDVVKYYGTNEAYITKDWRTELYLQGLLGKNSGTDQGRYWANLKTSQDTNSSTWIGRIFRQNKLSRIDTDFYFEELDAFWPQIYDLEGQQFYGESQDISLQAQSLTDGCYFLDFIDPRTSSDLAPYSVQNIGRRTDAVNSEDVNCLFTPDIPNIFWLNSDSDDFVSERNECTKNGLPYSGIKEYQYTQLAAGGYKNGAFDQVKSELWTHTTYQKSLSIAALPVFYLQPNTRVSITDTTTNTYGDFVVSTISIPLGAGNSMSVTCSQCLEKM